MRLMFVYWNVKDAGSTQDIRNYTRAAEALGHEVVLFAPEDWTINLRDELDCRGVDAAIFVLEWRMNLEFARTLDWVKLFGRIPRRRRIVLDCDGMYVKPTAVDGDFNHPDEKASARRMHLYASLADKIYQPTATPTQPDVGSFYFHAYSPDWALPLDFQHKPFGMRYVGSNWFRWRGMVRVLDALTPIRDRVGRIGITGHCWDGLPLWDDPLREIACYTDQAYLAGLGVELMGPCQVEEVIPTMSEGIFNPVLIRPLFEHLGFVTCRTFETPAANTIPLFAQNETYIRTVYGDGASPLVLKPGEAATDQIADVLANPYKYAEAVEAVRDHLATHHSYEVRLKQLVELVES